MHRCHILLWKGLSVAFGESCLIRHSSGLRLTWKTICVDISVITRDVGHILDGMDPLPSNQRAIRSSTSTTTGGRSIVAVCLSYQLPLEFVIRQGHVSVSGDIYVADSYNSRIQRFDATGVYKGSLTASYLSQVEGLAITPSGTILSTGFIEPIYEFSPALTRISSFGSVGPGFNEIGFFTKGIARLY